MLPKIRFKNRKALSPAHGIFCIGRNYVAHARELGNDVPKEPVVFIKPLSSLVMDEQNIEIPEFAGEVHHEVEILVVIGKKAKHVHESEALSIIDGFGVGLDMTARTIQKEASAQGKPWTVAKGFDTSAAVSDFVEARFIKNPDELVCDLTINGQVKQSGQAKNMLFSIPKIIAFLSSRFTLYPGDIIFTGTPEGVGPVRVGDNLVATLGDLVTGSWMVSAESNTNS